MSENWHDCPEDLGYRAVYYDGKTLAFIDEYKFDINYCPYCGQSAEELGYE